MRSARPEGKQIITSGSATTISTGVGLVIVNPASVLAAHTITMPANPADRDEIYIAFGGTIAGGAAVVTLFAIAANSGQGLMGAGLTTAVGGNAMLYFYDLATTKWYKVI